MLIELPKVKGIYRENFKLAGTNWFGVGGEAEIFYKPLDRDDFAFFLKNLTASIPVTILGVGSNLLVRDGGIEGVVIKLGREFTAINILPNGLIEVGAASINRNFIEFCIEHNIGGLEFLAGIPGSIGGSVYMNAGAYGVEVKDVLHSVEAVDRNGNIHNLTLSDIGYVYRANSLKEQFFFTKAIFKYIPKETIEIKKIVDQINEKRAESQPIRSKTGGSTFKNPPGMKAWELIDQAGCRGMRIGGASVSEKHCNFLINEGTATAQDIEDLGEEVRRRVQEKFNIKLVWEIKIIGKK